MSLTVTKEEGGVTVTVTSDPESYWPPLCQILWNMCHIPARIDMSACLSRHLDVRYQKLLGGIQMLVGVLGMFLVASLEDAHSGPASKMTWLGFVFITSGMVSILAEELPCPCLVILSVVINLVAAVLALVGIGLYVTHLGDILEIALIILAVLQILVNTSAAVYGMEAMNHNRNMEKEDKDPVLKEVPASASERNQHQIPDLKSQIFILPQ